MNGAVIPAEQPEPDPSGLGLVRLMPWRYDVQAGTGYSSSTVARGKWYRGRIFRAGTPRLLLPREQPMPSPDMPIDEPIRKRR